MNGGEVMTTDAPKAKTHLFFVTERLLVRQYTSDDVEALFQIMSDPEIHTYTKDKNHPWDRNKAKEYVQFMLNKDFKTLDCFHGAVIEKGTDRLIGLCGLNPYQADEPEIEFKLGVAYWGKGYATELGKQMIKSSFEETEIKGIYGMAHPENTASRKVLEKIGMNYLGSRIFRDQEDAFYYIAATKCW